VTGKTETTEAPDISRAGLYGLAYFHDDLAERAGSDDLRAFHSDTAAHLKAASDEIERLRAVLGRLARLGNEPHLGNSAGNMIARDALHL
jgi:hypothetical protein